jgi:hypothetical protein
MDTRKPGDISHRPHKEKYKERDKKPQERKYSQTKRSLPSTSQEKDLSRLSMEERLAVYKKKYTGETKYDGEKKKDFKHKEHKVKHKKTKSVNKQGAPKSPSPVSSAVKKEKTGIFSKLKGLFSRSGNSD